MINITVPHSGTYVVADAPHGVTVTEIGNRSHLQAETLEAINLIGRDPVGVLLAAFDAQNTKALADDKVLPFMRALRVVVSQSKRFANLSKGL